MRRFWLAAVAAAVLATLPALASAQTVRGVVVDDAGTPVPGVVLQLLDSTSHAEAHALSNERGEYRLTASKGGTYRISTLRIGFRPSTSAPVVIRAGADVSQRVTLSSVRLTLDAVRVEDHNVCRAFSDSGAATFAVWQQVRAALTATDITAKSRAIAATIVTYDRTLDADARRIQKQQTNIQTAYVTQPWSALSPDKLHRNGYVTDDRDGGTVYYAPGLDMLLSDLFVSDHCFRLTTDKTRVGIAFAPIPSRHEPEISGTLWLDRATSELRTLELRFVNVAPEQESNSRADMAFVRMRDGTWAVSAWDIRMPVIQHLVRSQSFGGLETRVLAIQAAGGTLALARRGSDTLWSTPRLVLSGAIRDSLSGDAVAGARVSLSGTQLTGVADSRGRFSISDVLPGEYTVEVRTPSLDSVSAVHQTMLMFTDGAKPAEFRVPRAQQIEATICGSAKRELPGIVAGVLHFRGDSLPPQNVKVVAEWTDPVLRNGGGGAVVAGEQHQWIETHADARGAFRLCGVPVNMALVVRAESDGFGGAPASVRIPETGMFARAELTLDASVSRVAAFSGTVVDSGQRPMIATEISIPDLSKSVVTDQHGVFRLADIAPGTHRVVVRHVGYGALDTPIEFAANQTVNRRIVLTPVTTLDSVVTVARGVERRMQEFEENRRVGLGHFLTREDLAKAGTLSLSNVLTTMQGVRVARGNQGQGWILSTRAPKCPRGDLNCVLKLKAEHMIYVPSGAEASVGAVATCYAQVYLDDLLMNPGLPASLFDVNTIPIDEIEAVEYYASGAETPAKYSTRNATCGVLVIHRRQ